MFIKSKKVWINEMFIPAIVEIEAGEIVEIYDYEDGLDAIDYGSLYVLPGFISIHDHGYNGEDANHASDRGLREWAQYLPSEGVTSFYPTTSTMPFDELLYAFENLGKQIPLITQGAKIQGIHAEGPMFSKDVRYKGSHHESLILEADVETYIKMQKRSDKWIKLMTLAPELEGATELIKVCVEDGVKVSIGHTGASFNECFDAVAAGAGSFTHTFIGMKGLHHREPGSVGAAMLLDNAYAEIIPDNQHVDFEVVKILSRMKGKDKLITVTDSIFAKGLPVGKYYREEKQSYLSVHSDGSVRLENGGLAGSVNKMNNLLSNLVNDIGLSFKQAINSVTKNPANFMGLDTLGEIRIGNCADIVVCDDKFRMHTVYIDGIEQYKEELC